MMFDDCSVAMIIDGKNQCSGRERADVTTAMNTPVAIS